MWNLVFFASFHPTSFSWSLFRISPLTNLTTAHTILPLRTQRPGGRGTLGMSWLSYRQRLKSYFFLNYLWLLKTQARQFFFFLFEWFGQMRHIVFPMQYNLAKDGTKMILRSYCQDSNFLRIKYYKVQMQRLCNLKLRRQSF